MKILLFGINARFTHVNTALYYLRQVIADLNFDVQIIEKTINDYVWDMLNDIYIEKPDVLCLSSYIWNQSQVQEIIESVKNILPEIIIVCGGPDVSFNSEIWLKKFPQIDYIIQGEGEKAFRLLAESLFSYNLSIINIKNYPFQEIPLPYIKNDFERLKNRYIYYEASRGCPFKCSYCMSSRTDHKLQTKDISLIIQELNFLIFELNTDKIFDFPIIIKFIDRSFNVNNENALLIWKYLSEIETKTKFHFEIHPLFISDEQFELFSCFPDERFQFEVGIQSVVDKTIETVNRSGKWSEISEKIRRLAKFKNIHQHLDLIAGLPGEGLEDISLSFNEIISIKPDHFQPGFLKLLPGTVLYDSADKWNYKFQKFAPYRIFSSNTLSYNDLSKIELAEISLELYYNSGIMNTFFDNLLDLKINFFDFFYRLGVYLKDNNVNKAVSDKKKLFNFLFDFIEKNYDIEDKDFLGDCLRYDWFKQSNTHFYPDFMNAIECDEFKTETYENFKTKWQNINSGNEKNVIFKEKLRNVTFFAPKNAYFKKLILENATGAVNVNKLSYFLVFSEGNISLEIKEYILKL